MSRYALDNQIELTFRRIGANVSPFAVGAIFRAGRQAAANGQDVDKAVTVATLAAQGREMRMAS